MMPITIPEEMNVPRAYVRPLRTDARQRPDTSSQAFLSKGRKNSPVDFSIDLKLCLCQGNISHAESLELLPHKIVDCEHAQYKYDPDDNVSRVVTFSLRSFEPLRIFYFQDRGYANPGLGACRSSWARYHTFADCHSQACTRLPSISNSHN